MYRSNKNEIYDESDKRTQRNKWNLNVDFFKDWSSKMAYTLGYFSADGSMAINSEGSGYLGRKESGWRLAYSIKDSICLFSYIGLTEKLEIS